MILDIKKLADSLTQKVGESVKKLKNTPHLTIVMVGNNDASDVYVRNKIRTCENVSIKATLLHLPETISPGELTEEIQKLNNDTIVHGILVQSPLPSHINAQEIFDTIDPEKDVDGFSSTNTAKLYSGDETGLIPGTPLGIMEIMYHYFHEQRVKSKEQNGGIDNNVQNSQFGTHNRILNGKTAVVIGKSTIVGKPLVLLLLHAGATVTICHSRTKNLSSHTKNADIIISAVGKKHLITEDMITPGALVIDVGINVEQGTEGRKLFGDCDTENIAKIADITPVPGGVGPMTIAMLLQNVLHAYALQGRQ